VPRPLLALAAGLALGGAVVLAGAPSAAAATAQVTIDVPAGKIKSVRLRHLPRGTKVSIALRSNGKLAVDLLSGTQARTRGRKAVLFRAAFDRKISFKVTIPTSDDYYLVFDNRRGADTVTVIATVEAEAGKRKKAPAVPKPGGKFDQTRAAGAARI